MKVKMKKTTKNVFLMVLMIVILIVSMTSVSIILQGCTKTVYVDVNTGTEVNDQIVEIHIKDFFDMETIAKDGETRIIRDRNTDILYYYEYGVYLNAESRAMTPIMEADGTPLTYTEWKAKRGE